jgi:hypothetical protein
MCRGAVTGEAGTRRGDGLAAQSRPQRIAPLQARGPASKARAFVHLLTLPSTSEAIALHQLVINRPFLSAPDTSVSFWLESLPTSTLVANENLRHNPNSRQFTPPDAYGIPDSAHLP